jgi:hypothetical protein
MATKGSGKSKSKSTAKPKAKSKAKPKAESKAKPKAEAEGKKNKRARAKAKARGRTKAKKKAEAKESQAKAKGKAKAKAKGKAKKKAEEKAEAKEPSRLDKLLAQYQEQHPEEEMAERFRQIEASITSMPAGLICPFSVSIRGGRHNTREVEEVTDGSDGERITRYRGVSIEEDPEELKDADSIKQFCYRCMRRVGVASPHLGVIVPASKRVELYRAIAQVEHNVAAFNSTHRTCELVFSYRGPLDSTGSSSKSAEAVVLDQMARLLQQADAAQHDDEEAVLMRAPKGSLPKGLTSKDVLTMARDDRRAVVAKVRADLARKAIAEVAGFELILPEEASIGLTQQVEQIKAAAKVWNIAAAESEEAYEHALKTTDFSGSTREQVHLVAAAKRRREQSLQEALKEAGAEQGELPLHTLVDPEAKAAEDDGEEDGVKRGTAKPRKLIDMPKKKAS